MARIIVETDASKYVAPDLPRAGEVWLRVDTGHLYLMQERSNREGYPYRGCWRLGAPEDYGCDPSVKCATWDSAVRHGEWIRVLNCPEQVSPKRPETTERK